MAKKTKTETKSKTAEPVHKLISENRKAKFEYEILDALECGIMLTGSEVKSLRNNKLSLEEAYGRVKDGELWLVGADIAEYPQASLFNHKPKRIRKLLVHREQLRKFAMKATEKGLTLVPLRFYFTERGIVKLVLGLCRGKKLHDKRQTLKKNDAKRDIARAMRRK